LNRLSPETGQVVADIQVDNVIEIFQVSITVVTVIASVGARMRDVMNSSNAVKVVLP